MTRVCESCGSIVDREEPEERPAPPQKRIERALRSYDTSYRRMVGAGSLLVAQKHGAFMPAPRAQGGDQYPEHHYPRVVRTKCELLEAFAVELAQRAMRRPDEALELEVLKGGRGTRRSESTPRKSKIVVEELQDE